MNTRTRHRRRPQNAIRRTGPSQLDILVALAEKTKPFPKIARGMFEGMLEGLAEFHRQSPHRLRKLTAAPK